MISYQDVLDFWFDPENRSKHFVKDDQFDQIIRDRFFRVWQEACQNRLFDWQENLEGCLAVIILLDQFSRNLFRDSARAFEQDEVALVLARKMIADSSFSELPLEYRLAALMPFMHAENQAVQEESVDLFERFGDEKKLKYARLHKEIIDRFGRFPHRNRVLGRKSSSEEIVYLSEFTGF